MRNETEVTNIAANAEAMNAYEAKGPERFVITPEMLISHGEAKALLEGEKDISHWASNCVFADYEVVAKWLDTLTDEARQQVVDDEVIMGWFSDDDAEFDDDGVCTNGEEVGCDATGEFMSTPCWSDDRQYDIDDLEHVARCGLVQVCFAFVG
jgi:hypothetical protein